MRLLVVNASPLILLGKIGRLEILPQLATELHVPGSVATEVRAGPESDPARKWLAKEGERYVANESINVDLRVLSWGLGAGESAVISDALSLRSSVALLDDRAARNCAKVFQIPCIGTAGVLLKAKRLGLVPLVGPELERLTSEGSFLHPKVRKEVLRLAGE